MILGDPALASAQPAPGSIRVTIDEVFRRLVQRRPDAVALVDPANRESFTDGRPRRLTYAEVDRMVTAIASRLRRMGLPTDAFVGIQLPNVVETVLTMLGVLRAGMIAAPMPLLWRRADAVAALARIGAKALITCGRVGAFNHAQFAMRLAAEVFSIRYVCAFGRNLPDGVVPFDDLFAVEASEPIPPLERQGHAAAHLAAVTFDVGDGGVVPVARNHSELLAGGLAVLLEGRMAQDGSIISTLAPASFAGICLTVLPWLLTGSSLVLHHAFEPEIFLRQRREHRCGTLILPAPLVFPLADGNAFGGEEPLCVVAAWRAPERLAASPAWRAAPAALVDVPIFGEAAVIPARRGPSGRPSPLPLGPMVAPRGSAGGVVLAEIFQTEVATVALRGAIVPRRPFPPGIERSGLPYFRIGPGGVVDTGYMCRVDPQTEGLVVTAPPAGIAAVGGYRFALRNLQDVVGRVDGKAKLVALPDPLIGQRLIGNTADRNAMQAALNAVGLNPLVVAAFHDRSARTVTLTPPVAE